MNFQGKKYTFEVISERWDKDFSFFVKAKHRSTGRTSCVNNLNIILSELGIDINDPKVADSTWLLSEKESLRFSVLAKRFLSDQSFLEFVEDQLDEDRILGEWANIETNSHDQR